MKNDPQGRAHLFDILTRQWLVLRRRAKTGTREDAYRYQTFLLRVRAMYGDRVRDLLLLWRQVRVGRGDWA